MSGYDLVAEVKKATGIESDYKIAQELGKSRANVNNWKAGLSKPDGETVLKLCVLGKIDPKRALEIMQGGYTKVLLMPVTAIAALAFTEAIHTLKHCILC